MTNKNSRINKEDRDEIDLIELFFTIWKNKRWVIFFTMMFSCASIIYALRVKEQWTSKSEIIPPNIKEMGGYLDFYQRYYAIIDLGGDHKNEVAYKLFTGLSSAIGSNEKQIKFLKQAHVMRELVKSGEMEVAAILSLIDSIKVTKPSKAKKSSKDIDYLSVSFSDVNGEKAQKVLIDFVNFIDNDVRLAIIDELNTEIATKIKTLGIKKKSIQLFADVAQDVRLENLKRALEIAQKAGIKDYSLMSKNGSVISNSANGEVGIELKDDRLAEGGFLFLLGENYLSAQIDTLEKSPVIYPKDYYLSDLRIKLLSELLGHQKDLSFDTFHYQSSPSLPLKRDKPNRALIVMIGIFLGGFLGVCIVLLMSVIENRKRDLSIK